MRGTKKKPHLKPYEIRLEEYDPSSQFDNPAGGVSRYQGSKYKLWINTSNFTFFVRATPRHNKRSGPFNIGSGYIQDLADGKVLIDLGFGGQQEAVRPALELSLLSGSIDTSNDRICLYDQSTNTYVYVTPSILSQPEVLRSNGPLTGAVPTGYTVGVDYSTGTQYYKNASGNWQAFPAGTTVVLTDLANGVVSINAGLGGTQEAIRPITELTDIVGDVALALDRIVIWDQNTGTHTKIAPQYLQNWMKQGNASSQTTGISNVATGVNNLGIISPANAIGSFDNRATNYQPQNYAPGAYREFKQAITIGLSGFTYAGLYTFRPYGFTTDFSGTQIRQEAISQDGTRVFGRVSVNATTWSAWTEMPNGLSSAIPLADGLNDTRTGQIGVSPLVARQDHIHPITRIVAPTAPVITGSGTGLTIVAQTVQATFTDEESVTYRIQVQCSQTLSNARNILTIPSIAGYQQPQVHINGTYRSAGASTGEPPAPYMGCEACVWSTNTVYIGQTNRTQATTRYVNLLVKYTLA